ncbi:hypothetical protein [Falsibacillus albus]|uniref:hypothetical protein n=1 Tax=Falsibacillus albus TaxID=2478915 RepID=UPI0011E5C86E|nr:hypothetical protein [Falsibacillus albus]
MVIKEAVCCPARERWGENGHQSGRLLPESRAMGQKWSSKRPFAARPESVGGKNGHQRGRLLPGSRAMG